jgi:hypothetical protein
MPEPKRIPRQKCVACGEVVTALGDPDGGAAAPEPGDPIACMYCGVVATIGRDGLLRPLTEAEAAALMKDAEHVAALQKLVESIKVQAMREALFFALRRRT